MQNFFYKNQVELEMTLHSLKKKIMVLYEIYIQSNLL